MATNLVINLISIVPLKKEGDTINKFFEQLSISITNVIKVKSTVYSVILMHTKEQPALIVLKNGAEFKITLDSHDLGNREVLSQILKAILDAEKGIDYENTILYCWGHAMGFSLFSDLTNDDKALEGLFSVIFGFELNSLFTLESSNQKAKDSLSNNNIIELLTSIISKSELDRQQVLTALTINELVWSLNNTGLIFDLIVFDNCYMQTIDTLFAMQKHTKFIIATQTSIHWKGYAYDVFVSLTEKINSSFCEKFIVESHNQLQKTAVLLNNESIAEISISCYNTEAAANYGFLNLCKRFISLMYNYLIDDNEKVSIKMASSIKGALKSAKDVTLKPDGKTGTHLELFEMIILFEKIVTSFGKIDLNDMFLDLRNLYPKVIQVHKPSPHYAPFTQGISICFPTDFEKSEENAYYYYFIDEDAQVKSQFAEESNWDQLITTYYRDFE